jgi:hypothetical protein
VLSQRLLADVAREEGGDVEKAATGDPKEGARPSARKATQKATSKNRLKR